MYVQSIECIFIVTSNRFRIKVCSGTHYSGSYFTFLCKIQARTEVHNTYVRSIFSWQGFLTKTRPYRGWLAKLTMLKWDVVKRRRLKLRELKVCEMRVHRYTQYVKWGYIVTLYILVAKFLYGMRPYRGLWLCLTQDVRGAYVPSLFSRQCFLWNGAVQRAVLAVVPNTGCQRCLGALFVLKARFLTKRGRVENRVGSSAKHKMSEVLRCPLCSWGKFLTKQCRTENCVGSVATHGM